MDEPSGAVTLQQPQVGSRVRFTLSTPVSWGISLDIDLYVYKVDGGWVYGLTGEHVPLGIEQARIVGAEVIDPGPYAPPDPVVRQYVGTTEVTTEMYGHEASLFRELGYEVASQTVIEGHKGWFATLAESFVWINAVRDGIGFFYPFSPRPPDFLTLTFRRRASGPNRGG